MKELLSPANLITVAGGVLTVVGLTAYLTGAANLSVPTLFYGFPIFLGGLALKTTELRPTKRVIPENALSELRDEIVQKDSLRFRRNLERLGEITAFQISKHLQYQSKNIMVLF